MTRRRMVAVAVPACAILVALVVALAPVTIGARDIVPEHLAPLIPESLFDTDIECGSVLTPRSAGSGPSIPIIGDRATDACRQRLYRQAALALAAATTGIAGAIIVGRRRATTVPRRSRTSTARP